MLIVNADDWGAFAAATDAIERCFAGGAVSSATAMVFMADSERAAALAREHGRPTGLHLNLTQPYDGEEVPADVREHQQRLCPHFANLPRRRWLLDPRPRVRHLVRDVVADQFEAYHELYGAPPTHLDSHHHVHVCPDVYRVLPRGSKVRQNQGSWPPGRLKQALLARRFVTTDEFHFGMLLIPELGGAGLEDVIARARERAIEIMVHPSFEHELEVLLGESWRAALQGAPVGSYADLPG